MGNEKTTYFKNLPIRTFVGNSADEIDNLVNEFRKENEIKFLQTNAVHTVNENIKFVYVAFYVSRDIINKHSSRPCPKCGRLVQKLYTKCPVCATEIR